MMKKSIILALIFIILISSVSVYANSGPTNWKGAPSSEILTIDENSPIIVENEDLLFDFTKEEHTSYIRYIMSGLTKAKYTMSNPSENKQTVQMAFPFLSEVLAFNSEEISIEVDEEQIPYEIYLGDTMLDARRRLGDDEYLDFSSIVESISSSEYKPKNYDLDQIGTLYTLEVAPSSKDGISIVIDDFTYDRNKTRTMSKGFNGYRYNDGIESIESMDTWIYEKEELEILVFGDDIEFNIRAYLDGERSEETDDYSLDLSTKEISLRDYLLKEVEIYEKEIDYLDKLADNQIFNIVLKKLDDSIENNVIDHGIDQLFSLDYSDRFFLLIYDVEFGAHSTNDLSVTYISRGDMDMFSTRNPIYTFYYILNPANNWALFKNINIEVRPPAQHPYIIDSSIELERNDHGIYTANLTSLPEGDFTFSLYSKEKVTVWDKIYEFLRWNSYISIFLAWIISFIIVRIYKRLKVNKEIKED